MQEVYLSYALDLKTEIEAQHKSKGEHIFSVSILEGILQLNLIENDETEYIIKNNDQKKKEVIIEHPFRIKWELKNTVTPLERTRYHYRFSVPVDPGQKQSLKVQTESPILQIIRLSSTQTKTIEYYISAKKLNPEVEKALKKVLAYYKKIEDVTHDKNEKDRRILEIAKEQKKIRGNMSELRHSSELYNRYVSKFDQEETEIEKLREEIKGLKKKEHRLRNELDQYLVGLNVK